MLILEQSSLTTRFGALSAVRSMVNGAGSAMMHGEILPLGLCENPAQEAEHHPS